MNRRQMMLLSGAALAQAAPSPQAPAQATPDAGPDTPDKLLLKDYRPVSIYRVPKSDIKKAKFPVFDVHCHGAQPIDQLDAMVRMMDAVGVEKTVIFTGAGTADRFEEAAKPYAKYPGRFDPWCGFDMTGANEPGFGPGAVKSLEACHAAGAVGVGELSDKGHGFAVRPAGAAAGAGRGAAGRGTAPSTPGPHPDDARMDALWDRCAQLGMPVNIHVSDPIWAYQPMDRTNDGLMNAYTWRIDDKQPGILGHNGLIESLEAAVRKHPKTTFIACHLANLEYDLTRLGQMFDRNPNLYVDIGARFEELGPIPRTVNRFFQKYSDRILYGTDYAYNQGMFSASFRLLETEDEHFYDTALHTYHWSLYGAGLPDNVLRKLYRDNAVAVFRRAKSHAA
jgi:predicted TIM-barrel fold metal-dependent hydrolase